MSSEPLPRIGGSVEIGSDFHLWRRRELTLLKAVWRQASAFLQEPTDPALGDGLRDAVTSYHQWRREGLVRGWQA